LTFIENTGYLAFWLLFILTAVNSQ